MKVRSSAAILPAKRQSSNSSLGSRPQTTLVYAIRLFDTSAVKDGNRDQNIHQNEVHAFHGNLHRGLVYARLNIKNLTLFDLKSKTHFHPSKSIAFGIHDGTILRFSRVFLQSGDGNASAPRDLAALRLVREPQFFSNLGLDGDTFEVAARIDCAMRCSREAQRRGRRTRAFDNENKIPPRCSSTTPALV